MTKNPVTDPANEPRPGAFGKLPLAADFIAVNAGGPGVRGFTEWLQEGVGLGHARLGARWDTTFPQMPAWRFLVSVEPGGSALAGVVVAGRDQSGRKFPFALFSGAPSFLAGDPAARLAGLLPFLERAEVEARRLVDLGEVPGPSPLRPVYEAVEGLSSALPEPGGEPTATIGSTPAVTALAELGPGGAERILARVGGNLMEVAARVGTDTGRIPAYGLRAPVPARGPEAIAVARFWVDLACRALGKGRAPQALFWSLADKNGRGSLDLYFRFPGTAAFLHLVDRAFESDALYPLDEADPAHPGAPTRAWADTVIDLCNREATLEDALARMHPGS